MKQRVSVCINGRHTTRLLEILGPPREVYRNSRDWPKDRTSPVWKLLALLALLILAAALCGCATRAYHASGHPWITTYSDSTSIVARSGNESITMTGIKNSVPTRAAMLGAKRIVDSAVTTALGFATGGSGALPTVVRAGAIVAPHVTNPQNPNTP